MTDRLWIGIGVEPRQTLRARAALPAAGAFDATALEIDVQEFPRLTIFGDYERGGAGGSVDIAVQWSPYQDAEALAIVAAGGIAWYPVMHVDANVLAPGTVEITDIQERYIRYQPPTADQSALSFTVDIPSSAERFRCLCAESGAVGTPGTLALYGLLSERT